MSNDTNEGSAIIAFGRSQMGKSSLIRNVLKKQGRFSNRPAIGSGVGDSCTAKVSHYDTLLGAMLDVPGLDDSHLRFRAEDISMEVAAKLTKYEIKNLKVLICESLVESSCQLKFVMNELVAGFGESIIQSTVVVATKKDCVVDKAALTMRMKRLHSDMTKVGIPGEAVSWQNVGLDTAGMSAQVQALRQRLSQAPAVATKHLIDLRQAIEEKTDELWRNQTPVKEIKTVIDQKVVNKDYFDTESYPHVYTESVPYQEQYEDVEFRQESYTDHVNDCVPYDHTEYYDEAYSTDEESVESYESWEWDYELSLEDRDALRAVAIFTFGISHIARAIAGGDGQRINPRKRYYTKHRNVTRRVVRTRRRSRVVTRYRNEQRKVTRNRSVPYTVTRTRTAYRTEQKVKTKTRKVKKTKQVVKNIPRKEVVEVMAPRARFVEKAQKIVLDETKKKLRQRWSKKSRTC